MSAPHQHSITLVMTGGIAAYKSLVLIRRLRERGVKVIPVMTKGAQEFVTPLSVASLAEHPVYDHLFDLKDETEMGHIRLMRDCDLVLVAPASAHFLAKMAQGLADDLASTALLASDKPVYVAPSMNALMWQHPATQANCETLRARGIGFLGPDDGDMACGDMGSGRFVEPEVLAETVYGLLSSAVHPPIKRALAGLKAVVTAGPTQEAIDPVRYISNHSSGKQGYAIADALAQAGANVTLISGPTQLPTPNGVTTIDVTSAQDMLDACQAQLPCDIGVFTAAVADWRVQSQADQKMKKQPGQDTLSLTLTKNPDILATIAKHVDRPRLVVGFAAETENLVENATSKLKRKGADLIVANSVATGTTTFGGDQNQVLLVSPTQVQSWPTMDKSAVAAKLANEITERLAR